MALPRLEAVVTADTGQAEAGFKRVSDSSDAAAVAIKRLEKEFGVFIDKSGRARTASGRFVKMTDNLSAAIKAAGIDFGAASERVHQYGNAVDNASGKAMPLGKGMDGVRKSSGRMRAAIQNASFQISDMAVMMEMGVSTSRVMAQQLPQLLAGFGALGAVIGTVVAIGIPMATMFSSNADAAGQMAQMFGTLTPMMAALGDAMQTVKDVAVQFAEIVINNLDRIIITAGVAVALFAGRWVAAFVAARIATLSLSGALVALRGALIRTGIGALIVGIGELIYQFTRLVGAVGSVGIAIGLLKDVFVESFQRIQMASKAAIDYLAGQFGRMQASFVNAIAQMGASAADFFYGLGSGIQGSGIAAFDDMGSGLLGIAKRVGQASASLSRSAYNTYADANDSLASASAGIAGASAPLESVQKIKDVLSSIKEERLTLPDLLGVGADEGGEGGSGGGSGSGGKSSAAKKLDEELTAQEKRIKDHFDRIKALTTGGLSDKLGAWGDYFSNLVTLTGTQNEKLFKIAKAAKAGQALVDAWAAYNQVLADPSFVGRPWARAAAAGQVLAAGIGAVNAIKGVSSSGSGSTSSGGSSATSTQQAAAAPSPMQVSLSGINPNDMFSGAMVTELLYKLDDAAGDNGFTILGSA